MREVDDCRRAVGAQQHVFHSELTVGQARGAQPGEVRPHVVEHRIGDERGVDLRQRRSARSAQHEHGVFVPTGDARDHDFTDWHAGLGREQQDVRTVLELLRPRHL